MPDNFSLIIKNGSCYINGAFQKTDIAISKDKIIKIGKIEEKKVKRSGGFFFNFDEKFKFSEHKIK